MNKQSVDPSTQCSLLMEPSAGSRKDRPTNVYIWDMDETLILLKSLLDGSYVQAFGSSKDSRKGIEIGKLWEKQILQVCDDFFYYEHGLHMLFDEDMIKRWDDLYKLTDSYTDGWLSSGRALLEQISSRNKTAASQPISSENAYDDIDTKCLNINVLVTSGSLIPSLVKCLLFRLDDQIAYENVYSSWDVGKLRCFSWIRDRFAGDSVRFCVIGDGMEECEAAERMSWPLVKMDFHPKAPHRLPGLTLRIIEHYMEVIYGPLNAADNDD